MFGGVLKDLSQSGIQNDTGLPIWIYNVENIIVKNKRYLKIYLFNRFGDTKQLNRIVLTHNGDEYTVDRFDVVSTFNDPGIVGCFIEIPLEDNSSDLVIKREIVNGVVFDANGTLTEYHYPEYDSKKFGYLRDKNLIEFYPSVSEHYWQCICGRINNRNTECKCGKRPAVVDEIINYDFDSSIINDYLRDHSIKYDVSKSFEDNIDDYLNSFVNENPTIDVQKLESTLNIDTEKETYQKLVEEENYRKQRQAELERKKKERIKRIKTVGSIVAVIALLVIGYFAAPKSWFYKMKTTVVTTELPDPKQYNAFSVTVDTDSINDYFSIVSSLKDVYVVHSKIESDGWYLYESSGQFDINFTGNMYLPKYEHSIYPKTINSSKKPYFSNVSGELKYVHESFIEEYTVLNNGDIKIKLKNGEIYKLSKKIISFK